MNDVTNTTAADPQDHLAMAMVLGPTDAILHQEAQGQAELLRSEVLPTEISCREGIAGFEALGFTFGDVVDGDPLFRNATLPDGWSRAGSHHSMWSYIVDERGVSRVAVFYKAAFYDRRAHMGLLDPGREQANAYIYAGDAEGGAASAERLVPFEILTDDEVAIYKATLVEYLDDAEKYPDIYGERVPRVQARLAELG